jgi:hypothetical protein
MPMLRSRRRFLTTLSLAGAAALVHAPRVRAGEELPETTVRLVRDPGICLAPQFAAEELLRAEGLTDIRYVEAPSDADTAQMIAGGKGDFTLNFASQFVVRAFPYDKWREYDAGDTVRFDALRLHELGMIKTDPKHDHRRRHRLALP